MARAPETEESQTSEHDLGTLLRVASALVDRQNFARRYGLSFKSTATATAGFDRDLAFALGYPDKLDCRDYRSAYERGGIAKRIVEAYPRATWVSGIALIEDEDPETETEFERAAAELFERLELWAKLQRADILAGLGDYSVLLLGAPGETTEELPSLRGEGLLYARPLGEGGAKIIETVREITDPRYGLPEQYQIAKSKVHWTRVLHIAENCLDDEVRGEPRLRAVWNLFLDLLKVTGGGAEAAWRRADPGMQVDIPWVLKDGTPVKIDSGSFSELQDQVDEYINNVRRVLFTRGVDINELTGQAQSFGGNAEALIDQISGTAGIPKRILLGSERGELASSQDQQNWSDRVTERRTEFAVPLIRQLITRLVEHGALPKPSGYDVVWPEIEELDETGKAEVAGKIATANQAQATAGGQPVMTADEIRDRVFGLGPLAELEATEEEPLPTAARRVVRAAKRRLAQKRRPMVALAELADDEPDEPEWKAVHRAADSQRFAFADAVNAAWIAGAKALSAAALEEAVRGSQAEVEATALAAADKAEEVLRDVLPVRLHAALAAGAYAALRAARSRGSWFRSASAMRAAQFSASFDEANPRAIEWAEVRAAQLIAEVMPEVREAVRELVAAAIRDGVPPRRLAREIRQVIGLRSDQVRALANLAEELRGAEAGTVVSRFPPREGVRLVSGFRAKVPSGGASEAWIREQVARYAKMQHNYRARLIARTETIRAANEGQRELWRQAMDREELPVDQKRVWIATPDARVRPEHAARHGEIVGVNEPWPWGSEPGEEPACRCAEGLVTPEDLARRNAA